MKKTEYKVKAFLPTVKGCSGQDLGWDTRRCEEFQKFLNTNSVDGWRLHSSEFRHVIAKGCFGSGGQWLVCVFEREAV